MSEGNQRALVAIRKLRARIDALEQAQRDPIAITGLACRLPGGADSPAQLWSLLCEGHVALGPVPASRWPAALPGDPAITVQERAAMAWGGFITGVEDFDAGLFDIAPREAAWLDPQHRLVLELGWEALETSGLDPRGLAGSETGVFVGMYNGDYLKLQAPQLDRSDPSIATGACNSFASGRLSYLLDLRGPCMIVDTVCSSSLVAIHLACQSLRSDECERAVAFGVNLILSPQSTLPLARIGALSPSGRVRTFDAAADGMVRGEGGVALVLERLSTARRSGSPILALIRGSAVNHDGRSPRLTAPSLPAQVAVVRRALQRAGVEPAAVGYVETHGTGTPLGDPIEVEALAEVLGRRPEGRPRCVLGALKTNIGHLEAAAGIAGVAKAVLCLQHGAIPANQGFAAANPHIRETLASFSLPDRLTTWAEEGPRIAGVSAFGLSGTNAHVVLEQAPAPEPAPAREQARAHLLRLAARDRQALAALAGRWAAHLDSHPEQRLEDLCHTAAVGRASMARRAAVVASSRGELATALRRVAESEAQAHALDEVGRRVGEAGGRAPRVAMLFTGQGSQRPAMARELYEAEPVVRRALDRCAAALADTLERPLIELLTRDEGDGAIDRTDHTQPALLAFAYALTELWRAWGVEPVAVLGHSVGEYAAACAAGVLTIEEALALVSARGRAMHGLPEGGAMAAVFADEGRIRRALGDLLGDRRGDPRGDQLVIAAVNAGDELVLSGPRAGLGAALEVLDRAEIRHRRLRVSRAFHSSAMRPAQRAFATLADRQAPARPRIPWLTNLTGAPATLETLAGYWTRQLCAPVQFHAGVQALAALDVDAVLEIGPRPILLALARRGWPQGRAEPLWLPSLDERGEPRAQLLDSLARLHVRGLDPDWEGFAAGRGWARVPAPTYPFQRRRHYVEGDPVLGWRAPASSTGAVYRRAWEPVAASASSGRGRGCGWLIVGDGAGLGAAVAEHLERQGDACVQILPEARHLADDTAAWRAGFDAGLEALRTKLGTAGRDTAIDVLSLRALEPPGDLDRPLEARAARACAEVLALLRAALDREPAPRLRVITRGAQAITSSLDVGGEALDQAALWGLGRVVALEHPTAWGGLIDLERERDLDLDLERDPAASTAAERLAALLTGAEQGEDQLALRGRQAYACRLVEARAGASDWRPHPEGAQLITGGLGALGLALAAHLVAAGARHLVLCSRSAAAPSAERAAALRALEAQGATVDLVAADVADPQALTQALARARRAPAGLRGVFHCAGELVPGPAVALDGEALASALRAKVAGARLLADLSVDDPLDALVCFGSGAAVWGGQGLGAYAAANAILDGLAHVLRGRGRPALTVDWGPWAGGGMAEAGELEALARAGVEALAPADALQILDALLASGEAQRVVARVDWRRFAALVRLRGPGRLFDVLAPAEPGPAPVEAVAATPSDLRRTLDETSPASRGPILRGAVLATVVAVMQLDDPAAVPFDRGLFELGLSSLMAVELRDRLAQALGVGLPATIVIDHPTITRLAAALAARLDADAAEPPGGDRGEGARADDPADPDDDLEALSRAALVDLLARELGGDPS